MIMSNLTNAKLVELRSTVPHCGALDEFPSEYLTVFAAPTDNVCLCCGGYGTFTWGLAHGEGHCCKCSWPARLYHFIKSADGEKKRIVKLLQYHPDQVSLRR